MTKSIVGSHFMQRTFVGVDSFRIFQEVYLRTDDPRVVNVVKFSEAVGDLKVEVISVSISAVSIDMGLYGSASFLIGPSSVCASCISWYAFLEYITFRT